LAELGIIQITHKEDSFEKDWPGGPPAGTGQKQPPAVTMEGERALSFAAKRTFLHPGHGSDSPKKALRELPSPSPGFSLLQFTPGHKPFFLFSSLSVGEE
jgi:hypothetical protein